jgi:hypothetical protein
MTKIKDTRLLMTTRRQLLTLGATFGGLAALAPAFSVSACPGDSTSTPGNGTAGSIAGLRTVAQWESLFLQSWSSELTRATAMSKSGDSYDFYTLKYGGLDANYAMFRATGKTQYLDRALTYIQNCVSTARPSYSLPYSQFRDQYLGWPAFKNNGTGGETVLYESYLWRDVTSLLRVMRETPVIWANSNYQAKFQTILAFTELNIFDKWYSRGVNNYIYRSRTHMASHWATIAMNLHRLTSNTTRRDRCLKIRDDITFAGMPNYGGASIRRQLHSNPVNSDAYFFNSVWNSTARPGSDVGHGGSVIGMAVEAEGLGYHWTRADMQKLVALVRDVITKGNGDFAEFLDGSGIGSGWFSDGWVRLGRYDVEFQKQLETHTTGRGTTLYGNGALNVAILSGTHVAKERPAQNRLVKKKQLKAAASRSLINSGCGCSCSADASLSGHSA